jgi:hypothetical protein
MSIRFSTLKQLTESQNPPQIKSISIYDIDISTKPYPSKYNNYDTLNQAYGKPSKQMVKVQGCYM